MPSKRLFRESRRPQQAQTPLGPFTQGVNEKLEPHLLEFSEMSDAANVVIDEFSGRLKKRPGTAYLSTIPYLIDPPMRAYNFIKRDGQEILLITDNKKLVATSDMLSYEDITPTAFLVDGKFAGALYQLEFETAEDRVWFSNGTDPVFSWSGSGAAVAYDRATAEITVEATDGDSSIADASLHRGDGTTWVGQLVVVTQAADTSIIGTTRRITGFDDALDKVSFAAITGLAAGDKVLIGVNIPRGRFIRYAFGTLFIGATPTNPSEVRFTDTVDPNEPTLTLSYENPHAWPSKLQIEIGAGDRIWGFSPIFRDRFAVMKAPGIVRIDPDPTFRFSPTVITTQFGSRFPATWRQHKNSLMFLGQDQDGIPDIYMTDFTEVQSLERKHFKTLTTIKQPNLLFRDRTIVGENEWLEGTLASTASADNGELRVKSLNGESLQDLIISGQNIDAETDGKVTILGIPSWGTRHECDNAASADGWSVDGGGQGWSTVLGGGTETLKLFLPGDGISRPNATAQYVNYKNLGSPATGKDLFLTGRIRLGAYGIVINFQPVNADAGNSLTAGFTLRNGTHQCTVFMTASKLFINDSLHAQFEGDYFRDNWSSFHLLLKADGTSKVWMNGSRIYAGLSASTRPARASFFATVQGYPFPASAGSFGSSFSFEATFDYIYYHENFKGDSLQSNGGAISPTSLPNVLPSSGFAVAQMDYKKDLSVSAASRFGKLLTTQDANGGTITLETASSATGGVVGSPFAAITAGQEPGVDNATPKRRFLDVKMTLTSAGVSQAPHVDALALAAAYYTPLVYVGADIRRWGTLRLAVPLAFQSLQARIRRSTEASLAAAGVAAPSATTPQGWLVDPAGAFGNPTDNDGFVVISDAQLIGEAFGGNEALPDPPFPDARHVQVELFAEVSSISAIPNSYSDTIAFNWVEGSPDLIPTMATVYKGKWILLVADQLSLTNDTAVVVDSARSIVNWKQLYVNFITPFRGKLVAGSALRAEALELRDIKRDDNGPGPGVTRLVTPISAFVETRQETGGEVHERKKAMHLDVLADNETVSKATIFTRRDEEQANTQLGQEVSFSPGETHRRLRFPAGRQFKRITVRAENNNLDEDLAIEGFVISYERVPGRSGI